MKNSERELLLEFVKEVNKHIDGCQNVLDESDVDDFLSKKYTRCDDVCMFYCTKSGTQPPDCLEK